MTSILWVLSQKQQSECWHVVQVSAMKEGAVSTRVRRLAACVHSAAFMQRYRSDLDTREARRAELARRWYVCLPEHNLLMRS